MAQKYQPCELRLHLENLMLNDVSDMTLSFARDNRKQLETAVTVEQNTGIVHVAPCFYWEEFADYSLIFSKMLRFSSGHLLLRNYAFSFQIKGGVFYSRNGLHAVQSGDLFVDENILPHSRVITAWFDENVCRVVLRYPEDPEEDEEDGG